MPGEGGEGVPAMLTAAGDVGAFKFLCACMHQSYETRESTEILVYLICVVPILHSNVAWYNLHTLWISRPKISRKNICVRVTSEIFDLCTRITLFIFTKMLYKFYFRFLWGKRDFFYIQSYNTKSSRMMNFYCVRVSREIKAL